MEVHISKFKCYTRASFLISQSGITLLKGPSGIGKSTILQAIAWCWYGSLRGVESRLEGKEELSVVCRFARPINGIVEICRWKGKGKLRVAILPSSVYEGPTAQNVIDAIFGPDEMWNITTCIDQGERNALLSRSGVERMDIIKKFAFGDDEPEVFIERITTELGSVVARRKECTDAIAHDQISRDRYQHQCQADASKWLAADELVKVLREIEITGGEITCLTQAMAEQRRIAGVISALLSAITRSKEVLEKIPMLPAIDVEECRRKVAMLEQQRDDHLRSSGQAKDLQELKARLDRHPRPKNVGADALSYTAMVEQERIYHLQTSLCASLRVAYQSEAITAEITRLDSIIAQQPLLQAYARLRSTTKPVKPIEAATIEEIKTLERRVMTIREIAEQRRMTLECPHCHNGVKYIGGRIVPSTVPSGEVEDIGSIEREIARMYQAMKAQHLHHVQEINYRRVHDEYLSAGGSAGEDVTSLSTPPPLSPGEMMATTQRLVQLRSIKVIPDPNSSYTSADILAAQDYHRLAQNYLEAEKKLPPISTLDLAAVAEEISRRRQEITDYQLHQHTRTTAIVALQEDEKRYAAAVKLLDSTVDARLATLHARQHLLHLQYNAARAAEGLIQWDKAIERKQALERDLYVEMNELDTLRRVARDVECIALQRTVDSINRVVNDIAMQLFEDPIVIAISLFKETKTTHVLKPQVNVAINYRGIEYDSIKQPSGGEADRISLALTLAFNVISGSPILFLDETMAFLNASVKESCLRAIRSHLTNKMVIIIAHEAVEGQFDHAIDLGSR